MQSIRQQQWTPPPSVIPAPPGKSTPWTRQLPTDKSSVLWQAAGTANRKRKQVFVQLEWEKKAKLNNQQQTEHVFKPLILISILTALKICDSLFLISATIGAKDFHLHHWAVQFHSHFLRCKIRKKKSPDWASTLRVKYWEQKSNFSDLTRLPRFTILIEK